MSGFSVCKCDCQVSGAPITGLEKYAVFDITHTFSAFVILAGFDHEGVTQGYWVKEISQAFLGL